MNTSATMCTVQRKVHSYLMTDEHVYSHKLSTETKRIYPTFENINTSAAKWTVQKENVHSWNDKKYLMRNVIKD